MEFKSRKKYQNWLLAVAVAAFCLAVFFLVFIDNGQPYNGSRNFSDISFEAFMISVLIIAPISEELLFRSFYSGKISLMKVGIIGLPIFVLINFSHFMTWGALIAFYLFYFLQNKFPSGLFKRAALICNALTFAFVHYEISDFADVQTGYPVIIHFALGCALLWITINHGIIKSMLFHFGWNMMVTLTMVYYLQFPDTNLQTYENDQVVINWAESPKFTNGDSFFTSTGQTASVKAMQAKDLYMIVNPDFQKEKTKVYQTDSFMEYDFEVKMKGPTNEAAQIKKEISKFLLNEDFIYVRKK